jgi:hypothetical protein
MPKLETIRTLPSVDYLRECFVYDPASGELRWKERPREHFVSDRSHGWWNKRFAGKVAGSIDRGYCRISIDAVDHKAHRLIWKLVKGEEPPEMIDQKDGNPSYNRLSILRATTYHGQAWNRSSRTDNTSGRQGVWRNGDRWQAGIRVAGVRHHLGLFSSIEEASVAYEAAARRLFGEFYRQPQER